MGWINLHSFVRSGKTYTVRWADDTDTIIVTDHLGNWVFLTPTNEAEYGLPEGYVFVSQCRGNDLVVVTARYSYPFASAAVTYNSPSCMPPVCDVVIQSIDLTHETEQGKHDGTATINATSSVQPILYSLNDIDWTENNTFYNLLPGDYQVYWKTSAYCKGYLLFTINAGPVPAPGTDPDPDYPSLDRPCHFFRLIRNGIPYDTEEPIKWDNVNFVGSRSKEWHGYRGMWSDGVIELEFDCPAGKDVLEAAYNEDGNDAEVLFQYGYSYKGQEVVLFPGRINFNTYKRFPGKVAASVEKEDFNQALLTRFDAKVSMAETKGVDGATLTPPPVVETTLHAKEIVRSTVINNTEEQTFDLWNLLEDDDFYLHPDTTVAAPDEVTTRYSIPFGVGSSAPVPNDLYNFDIEFAGTYNIDIDYKMVLTFLDALAILAGNTPFVINSGLKINGTDYVGTGSPINGTATTSYQSITINPTVTLTGITLQPGDKLYFYSELYFPQRKAKLAGNLKHIHTKITVKSLERTNATPCRAWLIHDVIDHCTKVITNGQALLQSKFLSTKNAQQAADGQGALYLLTNGKQIRQFDVDKSPLIISLKDALGSAKNIFGLGYGTERMGDKDVVRVERANYFYQNREIIIIEECYDYREEVAKDLLYNEVEVGYEKYQDSGFNTLDEFNTKHEYLTPIKTNKLKLVAKSNLIASGYAIEASRRQQFAKTATDSYQNDDDAFIIAARREGSSYVPEKDEAFATVTGVISPQTAYNLRISPLRMLLNLAIWIKGVFHYKQPTEVIKSTYVAQNGELTTQLLPADTAPVGDINRSEWQESQDVDMTSYEVEERIWRPEYIYFKCRLTPDRIQYIDKCMRGAAKENNYGYILVKDNTGTYQAGWLWGDNCIEYNYATEKASFKLLKKWDSPVDPGAACCEYLVINGCRILINGQKIIV